MRSDHSSQSQFCSDINSNHDFSDDDEGSYDLVESEQHRDPSSALSSKWDGAGDPLLHQILRDQGHGTAYSLERFAAFLQSQFCFENLAFWLAARHYKMSAQSLLSRIRESSPQFNLHQDSLPFITQAQTREFSDLQSDMLILLESFILPNTNSPYELNLSDKIRGRILKAVAEGNYHPRLLAPAVDAVDDLMKSSSYPLFLESVCEGANSLEQSDRDSSSNGSIATLGLCSRNDSKGSLYSAATAHYDYEGLIHNLCNNIDGDAHQHHHELEASGDSDHDHDNGHDRPWGLKAKLHFKVVSKALRRSSHAHAKFVDL
ncbi:hypothetical protein BGW38_002869 [Lunasporangiospora selenospora]|uniref:RGS domain-containing protein n=1 Tax=Lunasporangiospora selenospora TaxID=979761 RepID=A0A9P6G1K3_9FUNG|nr:hypothetical protein BGW38_002869 [Lunasporangiospora selenospora]